MDDTSVGTLYDYLFDFHPFNRCRGSWRNHVLMHTLQMHAEVNSLSIGFATRSARVWSFTGVRLFMRLQVPELRVRVMADRTYVWLFTGMSTHVNSQCILVDKRLPALLTFECLLASVCAQVLFKKGTVYISLIAQTAAEQFSGVDAHVHAEGTHRRVAATTSVTNVGFVSC